jgi:UDP-N-acetylmuramate dehydrogenase
MNISENISLKAFNTFGLDVKTKKYVKIYNEDDAVALIQSGMLSDENILFLGGGSNVLFIDDFDGLIVHSAVRGMKIIESDDDNVILEVGAGENWHDFVTICHKNNYFGLENLALIPGTVGAAPVQNIGAYGIEQKDLFVSLKGMNLHMGRFEEVNSADCKFSYRNSVFKNELKDEFLITSVKYKLSKNSEPDLSYKELRQEVEKFAIEKTDAGFVYDTVCRLRTAKLPLPEYIGNAGSFFKNPTFNEKDFGALQDIYPEMKGYKQADGGIKISAAWLIEKSGWKGKRIGAAGVYDKHALIIVNYGGANGRDIFNLSEKIKQSVFDMFGVQLEREVNVIGII